MLQIEAHCSRYSVWFYNNKNSLKNQQFIFRSCCVLIYHHSRHKYVCVTRFQTLLFVIKVTWPANIFSSSGKKVSGNVKIFWRKKHNSYILSNCCWNGITIVLTEHSINCTDFINCKWEENNLIVNKTLT
jgi:hypothetical protein